VTETVKAASVLASRLNEDAPKWTTDEPNYSTSTASNPTTSQTATPASGKKEGHGRTTHNTDDKNNGYGSTEGELEVKQAEAARDPLPDGTIPPTESQIRNSPNLGHGSAREDKAKIPGKVEFKPAPWANTVPYQGGLSSIERKAAQRSSEHQIPARAADFDGYVDPLENGHDEDSFYHKSQHVSPDLSSLPRVKVPKHISDIQETDEHIKSSGINSDSYSDNVDHRHKVSSSQSGPEQDSTENVNTAIFSSPKVAKILGGRTHTHHIPEKEPKHAATTPLDKTPLAEGRDQESFNVRESSQKTPTSPTTTVASAGAGKSREESPSDQKVKDEEIKTLADEIAKEAPSENKVGLPLIIKYSTDC
jgi:aarF domain-containing kinase